MRATKNVLSFIWGLLMGLSIMSFFINIGNNTWKIIPAMFVIMSFVVIVIGGGSYLGEHWDDE